jgi:hypothetical protein
MSFMIHNQPAPDDPDLAWLRAEAVRVREAIEATPRGDETGSLRDFPTNACHHATNILALHLSEIGLSGLTRASGERQRTPAAPWHVWLEHRGVIVDITADQFRKRWLPPVIVARGSRWHAAWKPKRELIPETSFATWRAADHGSYRAYRSVLARLARDTKEQSQ